MNETELNYEQVHKLLKISIPNSTARAGWEFDTDAIANAMDELQISRPVEIRFTAGRHTKGTHNNSHTKHRITISQDQPIEEANVTMWHELTHASQAESFARATGKPMSAFYSQLYRHVKGEHGKSYENNKMEIHARRVAEKYALRMLVRRSK